MRIRILTVADGSPPVVRVSASGGEMTAEWRGQDRPVVGGIDDVELSFELDPEWGNNLFLAAEAPPAAESLEGQIEAYDEAGMAVRIGEGIALMEPRGEAPLGATPGAAVRILSPCLSLWPTGI